MATTTAAAAVFTILILIENFNEKLFPCQWHRRRWFFFLRWFIRIINVYINFIKRILHFRCAAAKCKLKILWNYGFCSCHFLSSVLLYLYLWNRCKLSSFAYTQRQFCKNRDTFLCRLNERSKKRSEYKTELATKDHDFVSFSSHSFGLIFIKGDFIWQSHAIKIRLNRALRFLPLVLLLLMMHFKYFWHGKLRKKCHSCVCARLSVHAWLQYHT